MKDKAIQILAEYTGYAGPITEETSLIDDLGLNSLDLAELVGIVEDEFNIIIADEALTNLRTVGDVVTLIVGC